MRIAYVFKPIARYINKRWLVENQINSSHWFYDEILFTHGIMHHNSLPTEITRLRALLYYWHLILITLQNSLNAIFTKLHRLECNKNEKCTWWNESIIIIATQNSSNKLLNRLSKSHIFRMAYLYLNLQFMQHILSCQFHLLI